MAKYVARYYAKVYFDIDIDVPDDVEFDKSDDVDIETYMPEGAIEKALPNVEFDEIEMWDIEEVTNGE